MIENLGFVDGISTPCSIALEIYTSGCRSYVALSDCRSLSVSCGLRSRSTADSDPQFFSADADRPRIKASFSAYKLAKLWQNVSRRETDHATAGPCGVRECSVCH